MATKGPLYTILTVALFCACSSFQLKIPSLNEIPDGGKIWVVLVAGSNGYFNYRHQADVCHAYQIVHNHGIPDENIIVMMYDDIAENKENPKKGQIFNKPLPEGKDVYHGVPKDYTGKHVTNQTFVDVLRGKTMNFGSGKTLKSGPNDHVFVFFSDHGARGLVAFPDTILHATTFVNTLKEMNKAKMYKKMTIYVEACESGSMFKGLLPEDIDIFATTASNSTTSSYACYFDDVLKTFLGDVYSIKWMEDSDKENLDKETLEQQYKIVKKETNTSQVCQFGDKSIGKMKVADFQGEIVTSFSPIAGKIAKKWSYFSYEKSIPPSFHNCGRDAVPGPEAPKIILQKRLEAAQTPEEKEKIAEQLKNLMNARQSMIETTKDIINHVTENEDLTETIMHTTLELTQFECHKQVVDSFHGKCFNLGCNGFALRQINHFATMCEMGYNQKIMIEGINRYCVDTPICGVH